MHILCACRTFELFSSINKIKSLLWPRAVVSESDSAENNRHVQQITLYTLRHFTNNSILLYAVYTLYKALYKMALNRRWPDDCAFILLQHHVKVMDSFHLSLLLCG